MSAPSPLFSSLSQKLSVTSQQFLTPVGTSVAVSDQTVDQTLIQKANHLLSSIGSQTAGPVISAPLSQVEPVEAVETTEVTEAIQTTAGDQTAIDPSIQPDAQLNQPAVDPMEVSASAEISDNEKLGLFESVLDQAEQLPTLASDSNPVAVEPVTQAVAEQVQSALVETPANTMSDDAAALFASVPPQALPQATEDLWQQAQPKGGVSGKEQANANWSIDTAVQESGGKLTSVEAERSAEISPEVEKYLQRVERDQESPAEELAKLIPTVLAPTEPAPTEVARVLPVTKQMAAIGHKKSPTFSVRWLVEWSDKLIKMFRGKAVYRKPDSATS
ncbi:hypothetical protein KA012_00525 [Candidatus Woesebacteria bacterium]|nr:hypothetical protein [Candidatus Woesebacteria bacterium]